MKEDLDKALSFLKMRFAVGLLGETEPARWWKSGFLNATGAGYLKLIFPRTSLSAGVAATSAAACRIHDARIGRGRVAHLFRLPHALEEKIHHLLQAPPADFRIPVTSDEAFRMLEEIAGAETVDKNVEGPVRMGCVSEIAKRQWLARLAAVYRWSFVVGKPSFPYFVEREVRDD